MAIDGKAVGIRRRWCYDRADILVARHLFEYAGAALLIALIAILSPMRIETGTFDTRVSMSACYRPRFLSALPQSRYTSSIWLFIIGMRDDRDDDFPFWHGRADEALFDAYLSSVDEITLHKMSSRILSCHYRHWYDVSRRYAHYPL